jgi:predicted Rossmann fold flavoprotein
VSQAQDTLQVVVIGGGAAGVFGAIHCAERHPRCRLILLEGTRRLLTKVLISGGGRCNVTHNCQDPRVLVGHYPRGARELLGAFTRFQPRDTVRWFAERGVELKAEADGRMFPVTDDSRTIAQCLEQAALAAGVEIRRGQSVKKIELGTTAGASRFQLTLKDGSTLAADRILLATGSDPAGYELARSLGHGITPLVPSLFTFNVRDPRLADLAGVSFAAVELRLATGTPEGRLTQKGPLLITHWGLSGPAVLKLSAFGARPLHAAAYQAELTVNFLAGETADSVLATLRAYRDEHPRQAVQKHPLFPAVPRRFWARLAELQGVGEVGTFGDLTRPAMQGLAEELTRGRYAVQGKGVFKEEFVTAGGVTLKEVDFRTLESRVCPGLFFAGEVLDIDGITGGFNFQAAWTTAYLAAESMGPQDPGP